MSTRERAETHGRIEPPCPHPAVDLANLRRMRWTGSGERVWVAECSRCGVTVVIRHGAKHGRSASR